MVGQMTLVYIILPHNQEQAQCYQIKVNWKTQSGGGGPSTPSVCITVQSKCGNEQP